MKVYVVVRNHEYIGVFTSCENAFKMMKEVSCDSPRLAKDWYEDLYFKLGEKCKRETQRWIGTNYDGDVYFEIYKEEVKL